MINVAMFTTVLQRALQVTTINKTPNKINIKTPDMNLKQLQKKKKENQASTTRNLHIITTWP